MSVLNDKAIICAFLGPLFGWVPRVPCTCKILSSYVVARVNFYDIPEEQLPGTYKISTPLISGNCGLIFLTMPCFLILDIKNIHFRLKSRQITLS